MPFFKTMSLPTLVVFTQIAFGGTLGDAEFDEYTGLYIGADIGVADVIDAESTAFPSVSHQLSATGIVGGGLVGYDYSLYNRIKIGFEGFMNANGLTVSAQALSTPTSSYSVNQTYNAGLRVLPGFEFYPKTVGHLILGYSNAKFTIRDNGNYGYIDQAVNKSGFQCGLGMKVALTSHLTIRADALYTTYGTISSIGGASNSGYTYQAYTNPLSTVEGDLTLIYKFI